MEWKKIEEPFDLYEVSSEGSVRNRKTGKALKPQRNRKGYLKVHLYGREITKFISVHRLVAEAFIPNPNNLPEVNHKDEDKENNKSSNLEWCNRGYNVRYYQERHPNSLARRPLGTYGAYKNKRKVAQKSLNGEVVAVFESIAEVVRSKGFNNWSISQCCNGKRNQAYGYKWEYL